MFHPPRRCLRLNPGLSPIRTRRDDWCCLYPCWLPSISTLFSLTEDISRGSIDSTKVKVGDISSPDAWSNISTSKLSSEGHNIGKTLPAEWSNYLLIGGSHVSRTITLANLLHGNFNRFNWNRKTGRNADCPSSVWFSVESKYGRERFNSSMYRKLQTPLWSF